MLMLRHLGETDAADRLEKAVADVIAEGKDVTYDLKAESRRSDGRRHARNGRGDLQAIDALARNTMEEDCRSTKARFIFPQAELVQTVRPSTSHSPPQSTSDALARPSSFLAQPFVDPVLRAV